jgi:hypothetical protein
VEWRAIRTVKVIVVVGLAESEQRSESAIALVAVETDDRDPHLRNQAVHLRPLRVFLADCLEESAEHLPKLPIAAMEWQEAHGPTTDRAG